VHVVQAPAQHWQGIISYRSIRRQIIEYTLHHTG
jgi:hypothetical protein